MSLRASRVASVGALTCQDVHEKLTAQSHLTVWTIYPRFPFTVRPGRVRLASSRGESVSIGRSIGVEIGFEFASSGNSLSHEFSM